VVALEAEVFKKGAMPVLTFRCGRYPKGVMQPTQEPEVVVAEVVAHQVAAVAVEAGRVVRAIQAALEAQGTLAALVRQQLIIVFRLLPDLPIQLLWERQEVRL